MAVLWSDSAHGPGSPQPFLSYLPVMLCEMMGFTSCQSLGELELMLRACIQLIVLEKKEVYILWRCPGLHADTL